MKESLLAYGVLSESSTDRYADGTIENLDVAGVPSVLWLGTEISIFAGSSVRLEAMFEKEPSFEYTCGTGNKGICGYDMVIGLGRNLTFTGQTTRLEDRGQIEIVRENFGFDLA